MNYDTINLLGLQPDDVQELNITKDDDVIIISMTLAVKNHVCPVCGSIHANIKDYQTKKITHSLFSLLSFTDAEDLNALTVVKPLLKAIPLLSQNRESLMLLFFPFLKTVKD